MVLLNMVDINIIFKSERHRRPGDDQPAKSNGSSMDFAGGVNQRAPFSVT